MLLTLIVGIVVIYLMYKIGLLKLILQFLGNIFSWIKNLTIEISSFFGNETYKSKKKMRFNKALKISKRNDEVA